MKALSHLTLTAFMSMMLFISPSHKVKASEAIMGIQIAGETLKAAMPLIKPLTKIGFKGLKKGVKKSIALGKYLKNYRANRKHKNWTPFWVDRSPKEDNPQEVPLINLRTSRLIIEEEEDF